MPDFSRFFNNTINDSIQKAIQDRPLLDPVLDGSIKQLRKALIETFEPNKLNGQTEFRAICLRGLAQVRSGQNPRQVRIKARIPELHTFLPMPRFIDDLITFSLYPTFVGSVDDIGVPAEAANQDAGVTSIPAGSEVVVTFGNMKNWANPTIVRVLRFGPAAIPRGGGESQLPAATGGSATVNPVSITHANPANPHSYHVAGSPTAPGVPFAPPAPPAGQLYAGPPRGSADPCKGIKLTPSKYRALIGAKLLKCLKCGKHYKNVSGAAGAICADPIVNRLFNAGNRQSGGVTDVIKRSLELMAYTRYGLWEAEIAHAPKDVVLATFPHLKDAGLPWMHRHLYKHAPGKNGARPRAAAPPIVQDPQFWSTPRQAQVWRKGKWKKAKTQKSWKGQDPKMMGSKKYLGVTAYKKDGTP